MLKKGGGTSSSVLINGHKASLSSEVEDGDRIRIVSGEDVFERIVRKTETFNSTFSIVGNGPFITVERRGASGIKELLVGEKSGLVFGEQLIRPPSPTIVKKFYKVTNYVVALTFDDGPNPKFTPQILSILKEKNVVATFFVLGRNAEKYPNLLKEIAEANYEIGNHSYSHPNLAKVSSEQIATELDRTKGIIVGITGEDVIWFRPPGGSIGPLLLEAIQARGLKLVLWGVDPRDWKKKTAAEVAGDVLSQVKPGSVVLLHDGGGNRSATVQALPQIIDTLRKDGYTLVSLSELYGD